MGSEEIHRTEIITKSLSPIWTLQTGSLFVIRKSPEDFFSSSNGLVFSVYDWDKLDRDDILGSVKIQQEELLRGNGERVVKDIIPSKNSPKRMDGRTPTLQLRYKTATIEDIEVSEMRRKGIQLWWRRLTIS